MRLALRLPADLGQRLDAHAERLRASAPAGLHRVTRSDAARILLASALDVEEKAARS